MNEAQRALLRQQLLLAAKPDLRRGEITDATPGAVEVELGASGDSVPAEVIAGGLVAVGDIVDVLVAGNRPPLVLAGSFAAPAVRVYNSANISHATSGSWQALTFNSERYDNDSIHSTSSDTGKLVCRSPGVYAISGHVLFDNNATGVRGVEIRVGSTTIAQQLQTATSASFWPSFSIATQYKLAVDDYVELRAYQSSGNALNVLAYGNTSPEFAMTKISDG